MTEFNMTEFNMTKNINQYFTLSKTLASIIGKPIATESDINICILKYCKDNNLQCTDGYKLDKKLQSLFNIDKWDTETIDIHQLHHYLHNFQTLSYHFYEYHSLFLYELKYLLKKVIPERYN